MQLRQLSITLNHFCQSVGTTDLVGVQSFRNQIKIFCCAHWTRLVTVIFYLPEIKTLIIFLNSKANGHQGHHGKGSFLWVERLETPPQSTGFSDDLYFYISFRLQRTTVMELTAGVEI